MSTTTSGAASVPSPAANGTPWRPASGARRHRRPAMDSFVGALRDHQELAIFVTLALGFFIGRLRFGSFSLGTVVGTLLAGVLVGQLDIEVPAVVKNVFFDLFLFTTGYKVGPQFFRGLRKAALPQLAVTVVLCVSCLLSAFAAARLLVYDMGTAAGLLAGAFTESTVIGTAADAINRLDLPAAEKAALVNNIPVAYAVTYLIGTAFIVWFLPNVGPRLMRVNLKEEARKLQAQIAGGEEHEPGVQSAFQHFAVRAYRVTNERLVNRTVAEIEALPTDVRVFISRIRRAGELIETTPDTIIQKEDVIAVMTHAEALARGTAIGPEVERAAKALGYADRPTVTTDMIFVGLGIFLGGLVGLLSVTIGGLPITLTASGGALIMGLVFGWLRALRPTFGRIPEPATWVF